jgi:polar amino acid transport system substrate-binding protein
MGVDHRATRLRTVLQNPPNVIITTDGNGIIESFNPAAERMFGYSAEEVIGRDIALLGAWPYKDQSGLDTGGLSSSCEPERVAVEQHSLGTRKDLSTFPIELGVSSMVVGQQRLFVVIVRDISKRKLMEAELIRAKEKA